MGNPKAFWKYVNRKLKRRTGIVALKKDDGGLTVNDKEKAELLNNYFAGIFINEDISNIPRLGQLNNEKF